MSDDARFTSQHVASESLGSFVPRAYRADGGLPAGGTLQLLGILGIVGMILGAIASFIAKFFYLVLVFPLAIGCCLGAIGDWGIKAFRIRNPLACGVVGFLAGCLAMLSMHYMEFRDFDGRLRAALGPDADEVLQIARHIPEYKADWESQPEDLKQYITEMEQDPEGLRALQADNIWKYIDMQAHIGVELKRGGAGNGANLGYVGSYIYWGLEALIVAGITFSMMRTAAAEPFCRECRSWKVDEVRGPFSDFARVQRILEEGALERFPCDVSKADTVITLFTCPVCGDEGTVDVRIEKVTVNNKGETSKKRLGQLTYPGEALTALRLASTLPEVTGTSDAAQIGGSQQTGDV